MVTILCYALILFLFCKDKLGYALLQKLSTICFMFAVAINVGTFVVKPLFF
jgi:hypothetical protein